MSAELLRVVFVAAGFVVSLGSVLFAGFVGFKRRMDEQFDKLDKRFDEIDERFDQVEERFAKLDQRFGELTEQLETAGEQLVGAQARLNEATASARLESSWKRLSSPRLSSLCSAAVLTDSPRSYCPYPRRPAKPFRCTFPHK